MKAYKWKVLEKIKVLPILKDFYLAGGTSLALQLGHRTSIDFDFYCLDRFDSKILYSEIKKRFGNRVIKTLVEKDTMFCLVDNVEMSFFRYKYPLIDDKQNLFGVDLASVIDISAMKMIAVYHRPVKRDYIDIFYLLKKYKLHEIFQFVNKKYPNLEMSKIRLNFLKELNNKFDIQIFQQLPVYIKIRVLKEGKILFCKNSDKLYEIAFTAIKDFGFYKKIYDLYLSEVENG